MGGWGASQPTLIRVAREKAKRRSRDRGCARGAVHTRAAQVDSQLGRDRQGGVSAVAGDELLEHADGVSTRAIDIDAPGAAVWPWLAQMGPSPRGGAYTYDWIENLLGLNMRSTARVLPEFQHPQVGDTFSLGSNRMTMD